MRINWNAACTSHVSRIMAAGCERLLTLLNEHVLAPDGTTHKTAYRLKQARAQMVKAKMHFTKQKMLQQLAQEMSITHDSLGLRLGLAEAVFCLGIPLNVEQSGASLFGLGQPQIHELGGNTPEWQREKKQIAQELEEKLKKSMERLGDDAQQESIKKRTEAIFAMKADKAQLHQQFDIKIGKLYSLLREGSDQVLAMLSEHRSTAEGGQLTADYLLSKTKAMELKLRTIKLQLLVVTYSYQTTAALAEIRAQLDGVRSGLQQHLVECRQALEHYSALGPDFISLAQQFHQLKLDTENKRWAIAELGKSQPPAEQ